MECFPSSQGMSQGLCAVLDTQVESHFVGRQSGPGRLLAGRHLGAPATLPSGPSGLWDVGLGEESLVLGKLSLDVTPSAGRKTSLQAQLVCLSSPERACELFFDKSSPITPTHLHFRGTSYSVQSMLQIQRNMDINNLKLYDIKSYIIHFWSSYYCFCRKKLAVRRSVFQCTCCKHSLGQ